MECILIYISGRKGEIFPVKYNEYVLKVYP